MVVVVVLIPWWVEGEDEEPATEVEAKNRNSFVIISSAVLQRQFCSVLLGAINSRSRSLCLPTACCDDGCRHLGMEIFRRERHHLPVAGSMLGSARIVLCVNLRVLLFTFGGRFSREIHNKTQTQPMERLWAFNCSSSSSSSTLGL